MRGAANRGAPLAISAVGNEGPGADMGDAVGERVEVALGIVAMVELAGEPVLGNIARRPVARYWKIRPTRWACSAGIYCGSPVSGRPTTGVRRSASTSPNRQSRHPCAIASSASMSGPAWARVRPCCAGKVVRLRRRPSRVRKSRSGLRHCSERMDRNCDSPAGQWFPGRRLPLRR